MCESEFLLVKQAAAERLGVSPDRLRVKFISRFNSGSNSLDFYTLFYLLSLNSRIVDDQYGVTIDDDLDLDPIQSNYNFFIYSISCQAHFWYSGYSFEVV